MKETLKGIMDILLIILLLPLFLLYFIAQIISKNAAFSAYSQLFSLFPGIIGNYIRANFYRFAMTKCHPRVVISFGTLFSQRDTQIEQGVYIGPQCNIGSSSIGKNTLLGSGVHILSGKGQHNFDDLDTPIRDQGGTYNKVSIGEDSWIGNGSIVMANIGKKCIVGAGSVVTQDLDDYSIAVGNPAKVIKKRK